MNESPIPVIQRERNDHQAVNILNTTCNTSPHYMYLQVPSSDVNSKLPHQFTNSPSDVLYLYFSPLAIQLFSPESDVYGLSSGSGYEAYTPYGRLRAQLASKNGSNNGVFARFGGVGNHNQKERRMNSHFLETHQNPNRYATEWD